MKEREKTCAVLEQAVSIFFKSIEKLPTSLKIVNSKFDLKSFKNRTKN
jgi:hypothetical protein